MLGFLNGYREVAQPALLGFSCLSHLWQSPVFPDFDLCVAPRPLNKTIMSKTNYF